MKELRSFTPFDMVEVRAWITAGLYDHFLGRDKWSWVMVSRLDNLPGDFVLRFHHKLDWWELGFRHQKWVFPILNLFKHVIYWNVYFLRNWDVNFESFISDNIGIFSDLSSKILFSTRFRIRYHYKIRGKICG